MNFTDTVAVLNPSTSTDAYGNTIESWATPTETSSSAWVGGDRTSERTDSGDLVATTLVCDLPPDAPVTAKSRIRWRGTVHTIEGEPLPAMRRGVLHHYELTLKRVEG